MTKPIIQTVVVSVLLIYQPLAIDKGYSRSLEPSPIPLEEESLKFQQDAFEVLKHKCNSCHKKQNPFKIFSMKNMNRNAPKIYEQVFEKQRMPRGSENNLSTEEYLKLKNWLNAKLNN